MTKTTYSLNTPSGVRAALRERKTGRNMSALFDAIDDANLTDDQALAITYTFSLGLTRGEAAVELGITRDGVDRLIWGACKRIAAAYRNAQSSRKEGVAVS